MQAFSDEMTIRSPEAGDEAAIVRLLGQLGYQVTQAELDARLQQQPPATNVMVALLEAKVVGVLVWHHLQPLHVAPAWGLISALVIDEASRGAGVGAALLKRAEEMACAAGCAQIELASSLKRVDAHRFYLAQGYQERPKRFVKQWE